MTMKKMSSRFAGNCAICKGFFPAGEDIYFNTETRKASHCVCPAVPAAPPPAPVKVLEPVAPQIDALVAQQEAVGEALTVAVAEVQTLTAAWKSEAEAKGGCFACQGSGWIRHYSSDYRCSKTGCVNPHTFKNEALATAQKKQNAINRKYAELGIKIADLKTPQRGDVVVVARGRKVAKGTRGIAKWIGDGDFGTRVGIAVEGEPKLVYTALGNVDVVEKSIVIR